MPVLDSRRIVELLTHSGGPCDSETLVITPLRWDQQKERPEGLDRDSIDLHLGSRFLLPRVHYLATLDHEGVDPLQYHRAVEEVHIPPGRPIVIPAHGTVLGATLEYLKLPYNVSGQVLTRSSLARRFITIETAPWIHPLYRGCLTLEIANASSVPVRLKPGDTIAQLVLFSVETQQEEQKDVIEGSYFGPVYPELPYAKGPTKKTVAIVGASPRRTAPSNKAVKAYQERGWDVYPVHSKGKRIQGLTVYTSLDRVPVQLDRVTLYLPPPEGVKVLAEIAKAKPREFFVDSGVANKDLITRARALGLTPILACSIVDIGASPAEFSG